jgi:uncharacterized coiled-coil DUF342 family protein
MEDFVEEVQQQDSQVEEQVSMATEEKTENAPCETEESAEEKTTVASEDELVELEEKRGIVNEDAEKHRKLRDELNNQTKEWKAKRDALNGQVRELVDEAGKCREERDSLNQKVTALKEQLAPFRNTERNDEKNEVPVKQLKKQLQDLEYTQQTKALGKDKENEIIKQISVLAKEIADREKTYEQNDEVKGLVGQLREAKAQAEIYHRQVSEYAEKAQASHDKMIGFYEQADKLRKEADAAQAKFIECKQAADEEHKKHIEQIKSVHQMDRDASGYRNKDKNGNRAKKRESDNKKEAKEIFERFKAGDKLSTEDLMALQKSGYL